MCIATKRSTGERISRLFNDKKLSFSIDQYKLKEREEKKN